jgi:ribonuclease VapC
MILDSSAVVAVVREERHQEPLVEAIEGADTLGIGTPTLVETSIVLVRQVGAGGREALARFIADNGVLDIPFDADHWRAAANAFLRYGKGRHPARLNYGDCMTYATAKLAGHPLLFTGEDFVKTDLASALK